MIGTSIVENQPGTLETPVRNRYFYGKLLDVFHFELETSYMNEKRWMLNRLMSDWGVVCGLDVILSDDGKSFYVTSGLAIGPDGKEIVVPANTPFIPLPAVQCPPPEPSDTTTNQQPNRYGSKRKPDQDDDDKDDEDFYFTVILCYNECQTQPTTVFTGDCGDGGMCTPGTIEERYRVEIRPGKTDPISVWDCTIPDAIQNGDLKYDVLARWVTDLCPVPDKDLCIPLANICISCDDDGPCVKEEDVDISIRPLVLSNRALFYLLTSLIYEPGTRRRGNR